MQLPNRESLDIILLAMKIEVLPNNMNAQVRGKHVKEEKLKLILNEAIQKIVVNRLAGGDGGDPSMHTIMILAAACQMLWNELEDVKEELAKARADVDDAFERGYNTGSLETEHSMQENA